MNLLCRVKSENDNENLKRISLSNDLQKQLLQYLDKSIKFFNEAKQVEFNGEYKPDEDQVLVINDFNLLSEEFNNILTIPVLNENEIYNIKYLIFLDVKFHQVVDENLA